MGVRSMIAAGLLALLLVSPSAPSRGGTPACAAPGWLHVGGDVPADPGWCYGTLPNGVRFAVRRQAVAGSPAAIRVRIAAGALAEEDGQQGWAHLLEHMIFRGTPALSGERAQEAWQRLGITTGRDSNAFTSLRSTRYHLDLPRADAAGVDAALGTLAALLRDPAIDPAALTVERNVVAAERAQRFPPLARKAQEAYRELFLAGLRAEDRDVGGSDASLARADAAALNAFHRRWYRPERTTVILVGDLPPAELAAMVARRFGDWRGQGPAPAEPEPGAPAPVTPPARLVVEPRGSKGVQLGWVLPPEPGATTTVRLAERDVERIALSVLNQRLRATVAEGGALTGALASVQRGIPGATQTILGLSARDGDWRGGLRAAFGTLNRTLAGLIDPTEVAQQIAAVETGLRRFAETEATATPTQHVDRMLRALDAGDVAPSPDFMVQRFVATKPTITPAAVQAALNRLFAPDPRLLIVSAVPIEGGDTALAAALAELRRTAGGQAAALRPVSFDRLPDPGPPGQVAARERVEDLDVERVRFANGVELAMKRTPYQRGTALLQVRAGRGLLGRPVNDPGLSWSWPAVTESGVAGLTSLELGRLIAGRRIAATAGLRTDAMLVNVTTSDADLPDALRLAHAMLVDSRVTDVAFDQARLAFGAQANATVTDPQRLFAVAGPAAIYADRRFAGLPAPAQVRSASASAARSYWRELLSAGPVRVVVVGEFDRDRVIDAVARTLGAMPPRSAVALVSPPKPPVPGKPMVLPHSGDPAQAVVGRVWPMPGSLSDLPAARARQVMMAVLQQRLYAELRDTAGATYAPTVQGGDIPGLTDRSAVFASAQLAPARIGEFEATLDRLVADLAANGPAPDELERARATVVAGAERARVGNDYWQRSLANWLDDPRELAAIRTQISDRKAVDVPTVRTAARLLADTRPLRIHVLPIAPGLTRP